jgi:hypothetical protein
MTAWCVVYEFDSGGIDESRHYTRAEAMAEYGATICDPEAGVVAVWVTRQGPYDEWSTVVAGHDFPQLTSTPGAPADPRQLSADETVLGRHD